MALCLVSIYLKTILIFISCFQLVQCFSFNTNARTIFSPDPPSRNGSYFGYSLVLRAGEKPSLIIGAPKDRSIGVNYAAIKDPGAIYFCQVPANGKDSTCQQKILDSSGNSKHNIANGKAYHHRKDEMWLGMAMDGLPNNNETLVVCAPRWINQLYSGYHLANGLCYSLSDTDRLQEVTMLNPLVDQQKQGFSVPQSLSANSRGDTTYFYAYGQAGISAKMTRDGKELLLGAPGIYVWTGSIIRYRVKRQYGGSNYHSQAIIPNSYFTTELSESSYFGYSVDSGRFISGRADLYVAGAPRGENYMGQVLIFDFPDRENGKYKIYAELLGHQMGEYFGATLGAIDINQDGLTDLLVGAPMYAEPLSADQGQVYVYINKNKGSFVEQEQKICGSFKNDARFGTSISSIGDINDDGFTDIAIGAPYEDNGKGAVYIYLGNANGLDSNFVQRIVMNDMKGFGISISRGVDIDNNSCKDIAVGAYESSRAVLLRCHPSFNVIPTIRSVPAEIHINATSFTAQICFQFKGLASPKPHIDLAVKLSVDLDYKRAKLTNEDDASYQLNGLNDVEKCKDVEITLETLNTDVSRPITIEMSYRLVKNPMDNSVFCPECGVLHPGLKQDALLRVPFASGCGPDLICQPDLKLDLKVMTALPYITGSSPTISVNISIENTGEPAYLAHIELTPPPRSPLLRVPPSCRLDGQKLSCDIDNPMAPNTKKFIILELDTSLLNNEDSALDFDITAVSRGEEVTPGDNVINSKIQLNPTAKLNVESYANGDQYVFINLKKKISNITVSHGFEIANEGPTTLNGIMLRFYLPVAYVDHNTKTNISLMEVYEPKGIINHQPLICVPITGSFFVENLQGHSVGISNQSESLGPTETSPIMYDTTLQAANRETGNEINSTPDHSTQSNTLLELSPIVKENAMYLNCSDANKEVTCMVIECRAGMLLQSGGGANVKLNMKLNLENIEKIINDKVSIILTTFAEAEHISAKSQFRGSGWYSSIISGDLPSSGPPIWVILLALLLGILLLVIIAYVLYRYGFFKRKTKEELELLKNQENTNAETEVDDDDD